jgi:hypothetical protein
MRIVLTPSKIERFRLHITDAYFGTITAEKVIESIRGDQPWNAKMEFGSAFHACIEHGPERFYNKVTGLYDIKLDELPDILTLHPQEVQAAIDHRNQYPDMIHEVPAKYFTTVNGTKIQVNMRLDGMNGAQCHEHKTTDRSADRSNYEDSIQWKLNLLATEGQFVQYNVFQYDNPKSGIRTIKPHIFRFYPYKEMKQEVDQWILRCWDFIKDRDLVPFVDWDQIDWSKNNTNPL